MRVTSTAFRESLFQLVERALRGELIEVVHEGRVVRLVPGERSSKMAQLIPRDTIRGSLEDLDGGREQLDGEVRHASEQKWVGPPRGPNW